MSSGFKEQLDKLFEEAKEAHLNGNLKTAQLKCQELLKSSPNHVDALHMMGITLGQQQLYKDSLPYLMKAAKLTPRNPVIHHNIGRVYQKLDELDMAYERFYHATRVEPRFVESWYSMGEIEGLRNNRTKALTLFEHASKVFPDHNKAIFSSGVYLMADGKIGVAMSKFQKLCELQPKSRLGHIGMAAASYKIGEYQLAHDHATTALTCDLENGEIVRILVLSLMKLERGAEGIEALRNWVSRESSIEEDYLILGQLEASEGAVALVEEQLIKLCPIFLPPVGE